MCFFNNKSTRQNKPTNGFSASEEDWIEQTAQQMNKNFEAGKKPGKIKLPSGVEIDFGWDKDKKSK